MIASPSEGKGNTEAELTPRHRWRVVVTMLVLLFALGYLVWFLVDRRETQRLDHVLDRLRSAGEPVSLEDLKASAACDVPDDENVVAQLCACTKIGGPVDDGVFQLLPHVGSAERTPLGERLQPSVSEASHSYLKRISADLTTVHHALRLPYACVGERQLNEAGGEVGLVQNHIDVILDSAALEALIAADDGRCTDAATIVEDLYRFEKTAAWDRSVEAFLDCISRRAYPTGILADIMNRCACSDSELASLDAVLRQEDLSVSLVQVLKGLRVNLIEDMKPGFTSVFPGVDPPGKAMRIWWNLRPGLRAQATVRELGIFDEWIDNLHGPDANALRTFDLAAKRATALPAYCLWIRNVPSVRRSCELWLRLVGEQRAARAMVAAERFRLATDRWPDDLASLVPAYLDAAPIDPFDGRPIRFSRIPEGIKVWCIKEDLKDDGGDVGQLDRTKKRNKKPTDAGWVLLDPALRGRPAQPQPKPDPAEEN